MHKQNIKPFVRLNHPWGEKTTFGCKLVTIQCRQGCEKDFCNPRAQGKGTRELSTLGYWYSDSSFSLRCIPESYRASRPGQPFYDKMINNLEVLPLNKRTLLWIVRPVFKCLNVFHVKLCFLCSSRGQNWTQSLAASSSDSNRKKFSILKSTVPCSELLKQPGIPPSMEGVGGCRLGRCREFLHVSMGNRWPLRAPPWHVLYYLSYDHYPLFKLIPCTRAGLSSMWGQSHCIFRPEEETEVRGGYVKC